MLSITVFRLFHNQTDHYIVTVLVSTIQLRVPAVSLSLLSTLPLLLSALAVF